MKTTVLKRKALVLSMAMAFIGAMTLTHCKKEPPIVTPTEDPTETPTDTVTTPEGEIVHITLRVNQSNDEKLYVDPPHVYFETGDKIHVASNGKYVGTMTYSSETRLFSANIVASQVASDQPLHFYLLGNMTPTEPLTIGTTTSCTINISDQTKYLPVVSYAPSNENFNETTEFTAILRNQCALVKFDVTTSSSEAATCITGMNNKVTVSFATPEDPTNPQNMTPSMTGGGVITLSPGSGEKWAILLPQEAMEAGAVGSLYSKDGQYQGTRPEIPVIKENDYITGTETITLSVTEVVNASSSPVIATIPAADVTASTAICGGTIDGVNYGIIAEYGISYSTTPGFEGSTGTRVEGWNLNGGSFTVHLTGLSANTDYYYRAYATNANGTVYSNPESFHTSVASGPFVVTTSDVTNISRTSAVGGGEVTSDGGLSVIDRGICWSTSDIQPEYINDNIPHASSGVGLGNYSVTMTGLQPATTYYVWAYATNSAGTTAFGVRKQFSTLYEVYVSANPSSGGSVESEGTYLGSISHYGTYSGGSCTVTATPNGDYLFINWTENGTEVSTVDEYTFTLNADRNLVANFGLKRTISVSANPTEGGTVYIGTVGTTSAICPQGTNCTVTATPAEGYMFINWTENGTEVSTDAEYTFTIPAADRNLVANFGFEISVSANPTEGGTAYIGTAGTTSGIYLPGTTCTLTAVPNDCYSFVNWTKNGVPVSVQNPFTFTATESEEYVANFGPKNYTITISANPTTYGSVEFVDNNGPFSCNDLCTVKATANPGYVFENWTENDEVVVDIEGNPLPASFNFDVTSNRTLVANFIPVPEGAIGGLFSVNSFQKVFFSKGNLQYTKSTGIWSFMENQYDRVETSGQDVGTDYANQDVVSLFGWGTSGYNHNNSCYQPWRTDNSNANYYAYNNPFSDLDGQAEWGYNAISNGGNTQNSGWRTLTGGYGEWHYLFFMRGTTTGLRFVMATVNGVKGVILFPDNWDESISLNNPNGGNYGSNIITASEWTNSFEATGAVFLPAAGYRNGTVVTDFDSEGSYWTSSSSYDYEHAYSLNFISNIIINNRDRCKGFSVRLVKDVY